jgi:hypothetical protein
MAFVPYVNIIDFVFWCQAADEKFFVLTQVCTRACGRVLDLL